MNAKGNLKPKTGFGNTIITIPKINDGVNGLGDVTF
jgi:hypothetical protein